MLTPGPEIGHLLIPAQNALVNAEHFTQQFIAEKTHFVLENPWLIGALVGLGAIYQILLTAKEDLLPARRTSPTQVTR